MSYKHKKKTKKFLSVIGMEYLIQMIGLLIT